MKTVAYLALALLAASPGLMAQTTNQILGSGYTGPYVPGVVPGDVITFFAAPLGVPDAVASQTPLPTSLSGVSVAVRAAGSGVVDTAGYPVLLPIFRVHSPKDPSIIPNTAITVHIPTDRVSILDHERRLPGFPPQIILNVKANGVSGPDYVVELNGAAEHLLNSCDTVFGGVGPLFVGAGCDPVITHADGTSVSYTNPAKVGETIVAYAVGLGPFGLTGRPQGGVIFTTYGQTYFTYIIDPPPQTTIASATARYLLDPAYVGLVPDYVGLFQINITIPAMPPQTHLCQNAADKNATIGTLTNAPGSPICVLP